MREIITTSILLEFDQKNHFWGLVLALGIGTGTRYKLKFLHQCAKWAKTKSQKFWELIPTFVEVTMEKLDPESRPSEQGGQGGLGAPRNIFQQSESTLFQQSF